MKNVEYQPRTTKYLIIIPILTILGGIGLCAYRIYELNLDGLSAFVGIEYGIISPLILIFGGIVLFFIIFGAQCRERKMDKLNSKERQQELRNKIVKEFRVTEKKERTHIIFYSVVGLLSLIAYVLLASDNPESAKELILFGIIGVLVPITQAVKLRKYVKYSKLKELKNFGKCLTGEIFEVKKRGKGFLRDDTMKYQIIVKSKETGEMEYRSHTTRFNIPLYLGKGDKIYVYIDNNSDDYFVDIESAFKIQEDKK